MRGRLAATRVNSGAFGFDRALALTGIQTGVSTELRAEFDAELLSVAEQADGTLNGYIVCLGYVAAHAEGAIATKAFALAAARASKELRKESCSRTGMAPAVIAPARLTMCQR